jgi:hypothetical protein
VAGAVGTRATIHLTDGHGQLSVTVLVAVSAPAHDCPAAVVQVPAPQPDVATHLVAATDGTEQPA